MHVWNASGNYSVYVESINNVSVNFDTVNMTVQDPVAAMYMRTNSPVTRPWERGGWLDIEIYWAPNEALLATGTHFELFLIMALMLKAFCQLL